MKTTIVDKSPRWETGLFDRLQSSARRSWHALVHLLHLTQQANSKVEMLRRIHLFASCTERELRFLATQADAVQAPAGEVLTVDGKPPDTFYMLLEGVVRGKTAGEAHVQYGPGAAFDVVAMAERSPARATITAESPVRMLVMSHAQFRAVAALPRLQDALWRVTSSAAVAPPLRPRHPAPAPVQRASIPHEALRGAAAYAAPHPRGSDSPRPDRTLDGVRGWS